MVVFFFRPARSRTPLDPLTHPPFPPHPRNSGTCPGTTISWLWPSCPPSGPRTRASRCAGGRGRERAKQVAGRGAPGHPPHPFPASPRAHSRPRSHSLHLPSPPLRSAPASSPPTALSWVSATTASPGAAPTTPCRGPSVRPPLRGPCCRTSLVGPPPPASRRVCWAPSTHTSATLK